MFSKKNSFKLKASVLSLVSKISKKWYFVEVKDRRFMFQLAENVFYERKQTKSPRTQYEVIYETQVPQNQIVIGNQNEELEVKSSPK